MGDTNIGWTDKQWSVSRGCERISPGCGGKTGEGGCYAERHAGRFCGRKNLPFYEYAKNGKNGARWTGVVNPLPENLDEPLVWKDETRCFVNSMSDLFHKDVPFEYIGAVFAVMAAKPNVRFQTLTKRADVMLKWFEWLIAKSSGRNPCNVLQDCLSEFFGDFCFHEHDIDHKWCKHDDALEAVVDADWPLPNVELGVSAENQKYWDERVPLLARCPAVTRWVSVEPMLGPVRARELIMSADLPAECVCGHGHGFNRCENYGGVAKTCHRCGCKQFERAPGNGIHWVVNGGESGPGAREMDLAWAASLLKDCRETGTAFFFKQLGANPVFHADDPLMQGWPCGRKPLLPEGFFRLVTRTKKGTELDEMPPGLRVREYAKSTS